MSYRIYAFQPVAGFDPWETGREIAFPDSDEAFSAPQSASSADIDLQIVTILKTQWAALQEVRFDPVDLAAVQQSTSDSAPVLASSFLIESESGVRISLEDGVVTVWVPFCLASNSAHAIFSEIWGCLEALERVRGYAAYDPHLDQILNLSSDMQLVLGKYCRWMANNPGIVQMESAILETELAEDDLKAVDRPWYRTP